MYALRAPQLAKTLTMACSVQKQPNSQQSSPKPANATVPSTPRGKSCTPRGSLPMNIGIEPPLEFQWPPPIPVSSHTSNLRMNMMNQDPKDLHTARAMIAELRSKIRFQTEHIMKWRKAYSMQVQQHYQYQKEKAEQMNALTSQLLLLESRLKRKQKQIALLLNQREATIQRQQKLIENLSTRLTDNGLEPVETVFTTEIDSLNDSDSAVVLEDVDSDSNLTLIGTRRKSSGSGGLCNDGITIVRSISDAIETSLNKYSGVRRNNCFLRRPDILETVYSVEEDPEPTSDVAEKRDKFKNRSEKALSSSSTEGQIDLPNDGPAPPANTNTIISNGNPTPVVTVTATSPKNEKAKDLHTNINQMDLQTASSSQPSLKNSPTKSSLNKTGSNSNLNNMNSNNNNHLIANMKVPHLQTTPASMDEETDVPPTLTSYNRVMSNHRSVTKPKDVKYKRINKAKSKSLEELRGRLKNLVERNNTLETPSGTLSACPSNNYMASVIPQTAQSYA